ncbi:putative nucleolar MIF4G domain-containing protein 1-like [Trypanosoma vivax]|nr:putative nucleolar MIF4G domain-containing protein 1-like [Trypanosoma vivax]
MNKRYGQRPRVEIEDESYDRQRDRKQRRRSERLAKKRARIEAHEQWVRQRRIAREQRSNRSLDSDRSRKSLNAPGKSMLPMGKTASTHVRIPAAACNAKSRKSVSKDFHAVDKEEIQQKKQYDEKPLDVPACCSSFDVNHTSAAVKYVPPMFRREVHAQAPSAAVDEAVRRITNKLTICNVADMTREVSDLFGGGAEGASRAAVLHSVAQHINCICLLGAGNLTPIVSLPFAGLVRGLQLLHGTVVGAEIIEKLCTGLQDHLNKSHESAASNGALLLAHLYLLNSVDATLASSFLGCVLEMGANGIVCAAASALTFLRVCGEKLRKEAPTQVERVLNDVVKRSNTQLNGVSDRYTALLSFIREIVSGRTHSARRNYEEEDLPLDSLLSDIGSLIPGVSGGSSCSGPLKGKRALLRIMSTTNVLSGVTWLQVISEHKPPRWYVPGSWNDHEFEAVGNLRGVDHTESGEGSAGDDSSSCRPSDATSVEELDEAVQKMKEIRRVRQQEKVAAGQRLNTENKREIFQCIMNASDDLEAFTLLMHRDQSLSRLHDTFTVLLQCCYQEKVYNPYYTQVIQRFCGAKTSCKNALQFAIWDVFKAIRVEAVDVMGYVNLSCLLAQLMQEGVFALGVLRGLDLENTNRTIGLFTRILILRVILQLPPARLTEVFFGGDGLCAHDLRIDTSVLRENLTRVVEEYFVNESEAGKWIPHFYDVVAVGTTFDTRTKNVNSNKDC